MTKLHQKIVEEIVDKYKKNKATVAIALFGSLARGETKSNSDVDIEVITTSTKKWEWLNTKKYGIEIDLVICPKNHLLMHIEKYPYLCYDYLSEKVLYDPKDFMKYIKKTMKEYFDKHPEIVKFWEDKLKIMKENKAKGQDPKDAIKSYDEAEILFSKEHKVTRDFFR